MDLKRWEMFRSLDPVFASDVKWAQLIGIGNSGSYGDGFDIVPPRAGLLMMRNGNVYFVTDRGDSLHLTGAVKSNYVRLVPYKMDVLCGKDITEISSGYSRILALTKDGRVFQWGEYERYSHDADGIMTEMEPELVSGDLKDEMIVQLASGEFHRLALTSNGEVYAWGKNDSGQLGTGLRRYERNPVKIAGFDNLKIKSITCGEDSSYGLDDHGNVWSWGSSSNGVLGYRSGGDQLSPKRIPTLYCIKKVVAGMHHVLALCRSGVVYFWGRDGRIADANLPEEVKIDEKVKDIGALRNCGLSVCKTKTNVYIWGFHYGEHISEPRRTEFGTMEEVFASLDVPLMLHPLILDCPERNLSDQMDLAFDDASTADFQFHNSDGQVIHAHKHILQLGNDYFRGKFASDWKDKDYESNSGFSPSGFRSFIYYLYTNRIEPPVQTVDQAIELIGMGSHYLEKDLMKRVEKQLILFVDEENGLKLYYDVALKFDLESLQKHVLECLSSEINDVKTSEYYEQMSEEKKCHFMKKIFDEYNFVCVKRRRFN